MNALLCIGCVLLFVSVTLAHHGGPHGDLESCFDMVKVVETAKKIEACKNIDATRRRRHGDHNPKNDKIAKCIGEFYKVGDNGSFDVEAMKKSIDDLAKATKVQDLNTAIDNCNIDKEQRIPANKSHNFKICFWNSVANTICPLPE